jgi:hypothetical protein
LLYSFLKAKIPLKNIFVGRGLAAVLQGSDRLVKGTIRSAEGKK